MEKTKNRWVYPAIALFVLILAVLNTYAVYAKAYSQFPIAYSILSSEVTLKNQNFSFSSLVIIFQWMLVFIITMWAMFEFNKKTKERKLKENYHKIKESKGKFDTDLDTLYSLIKENKKLKLGQIASSFNLTEEKALEWAKLLESNNLVIIEYPAFSSPVILLKGKDEEA
jgi:hypothetical protein